MEGRKSPVDALDGPGGAWRGNCAGDARRRDRSYIPTSSGFRGTRHARAIVFFHRRGDCRLYQLVVERGITRSRGHGLAPDSFAGRLDGVGRISTVDLRGGVPPQGFWNYSTPGWRGHCYNADLHDGRGIEEALPGSRPASKLRAIPAYPDRSATTAGRGRVLVADVCSQVSSANRSDGSIDGRAHGHRSLGLGDDTGHGAGELSPDIRSKRCEEFRVSHAAGCPVKTR